MRKLICLSVLLLSITVARSQELDSLQRPPVDSLQKPLLEGDSLQKPPLDSASLQAYHPDSSLRIINLNPFFSLHVDSTLSYQLQINKNPEQYFWYLKNSPVGLRVNKDNGLLTFNANKALFLSGKLKYDVNYKVNMGVQNLKDPQEKVDTSFTIIFYNTEVIPSKVKPSVQGTVFVSEGETVRFKVLCESGNFPIENMLTLSSIPITQYQDVQKCGQEFVWTPPYEFVKETDPGKERTLQLHFIGSTRFNLKDTATVRLVIRDALNYPVAKEEYVQVNKNISRYVLQLKYTFLQLDKKLKKVKNTRTMFDLTSASTSLTGTILSTSADREAQRTGKILPSVGLALVPIKEASAPNRGIDQNQAAQVRTAIKRLEYVQNDNQLVGAKDPDIARKLTRLKDELKQAQMQLIDVPVEFTTSLSEEELDRYFNSPKVNQKYRLRRR